MLKKLISSLLLTSSLLASQPLTASSSTSMGLSMSKGGFFIHPTTVQFALTQIGLLRRLGPVAINWLFASLGITESGPSQEQIPKREAANARIALDHILRNHQAVVRHEQRLIEGLSRLSWRKLIKIALDEAAPPEVRLVAKNLLRREHIEPLLKARRNDDVRAILQFFNAQAQSFQVQSEDFVRKLGKFLFSQLPRNERGPRSRESEKLSLSDKASKASDRLAALKAWLKDTQLYARTKAAKDLQVRGLVESDSAQESIIMHLYELEEEKREAIEAKDGNRLQEVLDDLLETVTLFEALTIAEKDTPAELEEVQTDPQEINTAIGIINIALLSKDSERYPIGGAFDLQAIAMGFRQDTVAIKEAENTDISGKVHRLSIGGGDRYMRGDLIIAHDKAGHAGEAYKLFVKTKKDWRYEDTVIPVRIDKKWLFLCLDRGNKKELVGYWTLVDIDGNWWKVKKDQPNATLEAIQWPSLDPKAEE